jgi:hypothetical protein
VTKFCEIERGHINVRSVVTEEKLKKVNSVIFT